jgi:hypothetical protein
MKAVTLHPLQLIPPFQMPNSFSRLCIYLTLFIQGGLWTVLGAQQIPDFPFSSTSDHGCHSCIDTVQFLWVQRIYDIGLLLPEWNPVVDWDHVEAVEGIVVPYDTTYTGTHVSQEDFSAYHYTHDFGFNVLPDAPYRRLLARRIYTGHEIEHPVGHPDTLIDRNLHVEWESGLAIDADDNPCAEANRRGESCGFFSAGHQRREVIWNWPSMGDWVHCEGVWIWDRGHPPARTELHPLRLCATRRAMRAYVPATASGRDSVHAMQIDIFASGDGGALYNNRADAVPFAHKTPMSSKDYAFDVPVDWLPDHSNSSTQATLRYRIETHRGDTYTGAFAVAANGKSVHVTIPWQQVADDAIFARTVFVWWENAGAQRIEPATQTYEIHFQDLHFTQRKDVLSRPEKVMWLEAGGQYLCLNEFIEGQNIMRDGQAKTYNRDWKIDLKLRVHAMPGQVFRVHVGGWENDGVSRVYGQLLDPDMPCTKASKKLLHSHLWPATPFTMHGCLDDLIGEVHDFYSTDTLPAFLQVETKSTGRDNELEPCPGANTEQNDVFTVRYSIRRLED